MLRLSKFASIFLNSVVALVLVASASYAEGVIDLPNSDAVPAEEPLILSLRDLNPSIAYWVTLVPAGTPDGRWDEYSYIEDAQQAEVTFAGVPAGQYELRLHDRASGYELYDRVAVTVMDGSQAEESDAQPVAEDAVAATWQDLHGRYSGVTQVDYLGYVELDLTVVEGGALFDYTVRRRTCVTALLDPDAEGYRAAEPYSTRNACYDGTAVAIRSLSDEGATLDVKIDGSAFTFVLPLVQGPLPDAVGPIEGAKDLRGFTASMTGADFEALAVELGYKLHDGPIRGAPTLGRDDGLNHRILSAYKLVEDTDRARDVILIRLQSYDVKDFTERYATASREERRAAILDSPGLFVVRWQSFPDGEQPSGRRVDESLRAKYGEPSVVKDANRGPGASDYAWHASPDDGKRHETPEACAIERHNGFGSMQLQAPVGVLRMNTGPATAFISAQPSCGVSVYAASSTDNLEASTRLTMIAIDHRAYLNELWTQTEGRVRATVEELAQARAQSDGVDPDL